MNPIARRQRKIIDVTRPCGCVVQVIHAGAATTDWIVRNYQQTPCEDHQPK